MTDLLKLLTPQTLIAAWLALLAVCNAGCAPRAMPAEYSSFVDAFKTSALSQADWKDIIAETRGHVINPGLRFEAGITYYALARLEGVDGSVELVAEGSGTGEGPSAEMKAALIADYQRRGEPLPAWLLEVLREPPPASQP